MFHWRTLNELPDLLAIHQHAPDQYPYLLASNTQGQLNTRWSLLLAYPSKIHTQTVTGPDILDHIDLTFGSINPSQDLPTADFPFTGGWFVFLSYEYARFIEPAVNFYHDPHGIPVAQIARIPAAVVIDHQNQQAYLVSDPHHRHLLDEMEMQIAMVPSFSPRPLPTADIEEEVGEKYQQMVSRTLHYIRDGDIFQANLSRLWKARFPSTCDAAQLFHWLKLHNPAPFSTLARIGNSHVISSSPERLVSVAGSKIETRPIAGTHPRDSDISKDKELSERLLSHPKERAEHIMLIDLERNDLGRLCQPGSIQVNERMILETYQHVHHIVSSVKGLLRRDLSAREIIHAVFPGGTITGCPKVRCMQIISELEQQARGAYTGSIGYISDHGTMDLNILIRTITLHEDLALFRAGAGIVADSDIDRELQETRHKARGMINAIQVNH